MARPSLVAPGRYRFEVTGALCSSHRADSDPLFAPSAGGETARSLALAVHAYRGEQLKVAVELAEVAAGLPMAVSFAVASGITSLREGRRRTALNEALHELRRPLQVLALLPAADPPEVEARESSLRMAAAALESLDRAINGESIQRPSAPVEMKALLEAAIRRWRTSTVFRGVKLQLRWRAAGALVIADELELSQAVDNLISNAIEHGGGKVVIDAFEVGGRLRLAVVDSGVGATGSRRRPGLRERVGGRSRHGHGLRVVARTAARHGGSFHLRRLGSGTEARLELPLRAGETDR